MRQVSSLAYRWNIDHGKRGWLLRTQTHCKAVFDWFSELQARVPTDGSNCLESQVISQGLQAVLVRSMALRIVSNFRMHAMSATFFGLPAATKRR